MLRSLILRLNHLKPGIYLHSDVRSFKQGRISNPSFSDVEDNYFQDKDDLLHDPDWLQYESLQDMEDDQLVMLHERKNSKSWQLATKRERQFLKKKILMRKYFKQEREAPLLTWEAMCQVKYLAREHPKEWTLDKLEESFPVSRNALIRILKQGDKITTPDEIRRHNNKVRRHWRALKSGDFQHDRHLVAAYNSLKEKNKFFLLVNAAGIQNVPMPVNVKMEMNEIEKRLALPGGVRTSELRVTPFTSILRKHKAWPSTEDELFSAEKDKEKKREEKQAFLTELKAQSVADNRMLASFAAAKSQGETKGSNVYLASGYRKNNSMDSGYVNTGSRVMDKRLSEYDSHTDNDYINVELSGDEMAEYSNVSADRVEHIGKKESLNIVQKMVSVDCIESKPLSRKERRKLLSNKTKSEITRQKDLNWLKEKELPVVPEVKDTCNLRILQMSGTCKISKHNNDSTVNYWQEKEEVHAERSQKLKASSDYQTLNMGDNSVETERISITGKHYNSIHNKPLYKSYKRPFSESEIEKRQEENAGFLNNSGQNLNFSRRDNHYSNEREAEFGEKDMHPRMKSGRVGYWKREMSKKIRQRKPRDVMFYQEGQCVYDEDGELLYRVP